MLQREIEEPFEAKGVVDISRKHVGKRQGGGGEKVGLKAWIIYLDHKRGGVHGLCF